MLGKRKSKDYLFVCFLENPRNGINYNNRCQIGKCSTRHTEYNSWGVLLLSIQGEEEGITSGKEAAVETRLVQKKLGCS